MRDLSSDGGYHWDFNVKDRFFYKNNYKKRVEFLFNILYNLIDFRRFHQNKATNLDLLFLSQGEKSRRKRVSPNHLREGYTNPPFSLLKIGL